MKRYERPVVVVNEALAEGVYAASGAGCYTVSGRFQQAVDSEGRYIFQIDAVHNPEDMHHSQGQVLVVTFDRVVRYHSSQGTLTAGDGSNTLTIQYAYHNNANAGANIGFGDLCVYAEGQPAITAISMSSCTLCTQHTW